MKNLIQITAVLFLLVQSIGFSQEKKTEITSEKEIAETQVDTNQLKNFVGKYLLVEADFELEIVQENDKMYIISPFSKDILIQKNETTLQEPIRGVDLELIKDNNDALKFTQNGYETIIERVDSKTKE